MRLGVLVRVSTFSQARALVAADHQAYSERRTLALIGSVADDESQERNGLQEAYVRYNAGTDEDEDVTTN